ncbi:MAG TPA: SUMF1/EgtB/PvdO family nonheme iron enzyme [Polyangiaceae bacterium]|nr:SUMF1/EgtB/PvdO family nonheme iron enzyme [Polyangiaceae bacterium]
MRVRGRDPMMRRATRASLGLMFATACAVDTAPARPQWRVSVGTDAQVPRFGQQLLVEMIDLDGNVARGQDRRRLIDASRPELWPISFGIVPAQGEPPPRLRIRLVRLDEVGADGLPAGSLHIDSTARLPPASGGVTDVAATLAMACFGVPPDVVAARTCDPGSGRLAQEPTLRAGVGAASLPAAGSWGPGREVPCSTQPPPGMVCVPGGAFLLGSAHFFPLPHGYDPAPRHLVHVSPFAIDTEEFTVGQAQALVGTGKLTAPLSTERDSTLSPQECTYGRAGDPSRAGSPLNCVTWAQADAACRLAGKRLPTEAQWEYAAGNTGDGTTYPWGGDEDVCANAVVARGRDPVSEPIECRETAAMPGPGPVAGGSAGDATRSGVRDLGGNLQEWTADAIDDYSGPCWAGHAEPLNDPTCSASPSPGRAVRGASWRSLPVSAHSFSRDFAPEDTADVSIGFRCALSM